MARSKSIFSSKCEDSVRTAKSYRNQAKSMLDKVPLWRKLEAFHKLNPFPLPDNVYNIECYKDYLGRTEYSLEYKDDSNRAEIGRVLGIAKWDREVDEYYGNVALRAEVNTIIGKIKIVLNNGSLAPGCRLEEYTETQVVKRFKSVCGDTQSQQNDDDEIVLTLE